MKIGIFVDAFFPSIDGVVIGIHSVACEFSKQHDVTIFTAAPSEGKYDDSKYPYKVIRCKSKKMTTFKTGYDRAFPARDKVFKKKLRESNLDIVHIRSPFGLGMIGVAYAKKHHIPCVSTLHSQYQQDFYRYTHSNFLANLATRYVMALYNHCDENWVVNESTKQISLQYGIKKQPITMKNGTDMMPIENVEEARNLINHDYLLEDDTPLLLYTGRISSLKNIFFILDGIKLLKAKGYNFKMMYVGTGPDLERLKKKVKEYNLNEVVIFANLIQDKHYLAKIYARSYLFLFPSFYDTDGVVRKEAASQKVPSIVIEGSMVEKNILKDHNTYVCKNNVEDFTNVIIDALENHEKYEYISKNAFLEIYVPWKDTISKTLSRYENLISQYKEKEKTNG